MKRKGDIPRIGPGAEALFARLKEDKPETAKSDLKAQQLVAKFRSAATPLEKYVADGGLLSDHLVKSLVDHMPAVRRLMNVWARRNGLQ
ncbi:hypothetical protein W02_24580 [Nitrospira sp. KM1]|uniref:hypothetical protein n=1 Tax=Nitrospira sp. KM1 TaxID=1936990 RepID=UPI0013A76EEB|nr:hypothetical protein [Nitrospira sp. KM1]BCA55318.1 hypothetical protein W02_24580 [Nitrospira sp. KM1]